MKIYGPEDVLMIFFRDYHRRAVLKRSGDKEYYVIEITKKQADWIFNAAYQKRRGEEILPLDSGKPGRKIRLVPEGSKVTFTVVQEEETGRNYIRFPKP